MKQRVRDLLSGTPLEPLAKRAYARFSPSKDAEYDRQTIAVMKRVLSADSNCVDIGCHKGAILREMFKFAPSGVHYAFEPIPELYRYLAETFPADHIYQIALSDRPGVTTFHHVLSRPAYSGIRRRKYPGSDEVVEQIEVRQDTLDNVLAGEIPIHFVKIDVEGAELAVLRGAVRTIRDNKPIIVFEHGLGGADYYGAKPEEVYELLSARCGLRVSLMKRWIRNEKALDLEGFVEQFKNGTNYYFIAYP